MGKLLEQLLSIIHQTADKVLAGSGLQAEAFACVDGLKWSESFGSTCILAKTDCLYLVTQANLLKLCLILDPFQLIFLEWLKFVGGLHLQSLIQPLMLGSRLFEYIQFFDRYDYHFPECRIKKKENIKKKKADIPCLHGWRRVSFVTFLFSSSVRVLIPSLAWLFHSFYIGHLIWHFVYF